MCDVTFSPKSWENCYVTVQDYRRRFADPYYIGVWDADYTLTCKYISNNAKVGVVIGEERLFDIGLFPVINISVLN